MPTIQDIRQQYPQYQDMSDGDLANALHQKFYSDMPQDQFNAKIGMAPPAPVQQPAPDPQAAQDNFHRSTILPLGKDMKTGAISMAVPGLLKGIYDSTVDAVTAPGRAMSGELPVLGPDGNVTPQAIQAGMNFASVFSPASPASTLERTVPAAAAPALSEGQNAALSAQRLGVDLPRAVASDSPIVQQMGKVVSNVPIGGTPLRTASTDAIKQLGDAATNIQQGFGAGDVAGAGSALLQGIKDYSANTLDDAVSKKYDLVDNLVNPNVTSPLSSTQKIVQQIQDRRVAAALPQDGSATSIVSDAINRPGGLTYSGVKDLRTTIGGYLKNPQLAPAGSDQNELRAIYGSLSDDLGNAVKASDHPTIAARLAGQPAPDVNKAYNAFTDANSFAAKTIAEQKQLDKIIAPQSDEGLFSKIHAMAGSTSSADISNLARARSAVSPETWDQVSSAVISKMGRDSDGNFSPDRFVTAYGKLSQNGKSILFKTTGKDNLASSLDDIANVSRRFKQLNQYANPSGTGQTVAGMSYLTGAFVEPTTVVSSLAGTRVLANIMAKPTSASKLAEWTKAYEAAATAPTMSSSNMLGARAKVLALSIASENGAAAQFGQLVNALSRVRQVPAQQGNKNQGAQENQQNGVGAQPRMLLPNET
jgi:hypothetical protein